jgi:hypothetical protein
MVALRLAERLDACNSGHPDDDRAQDEKEKLLLSHDALL